MEMTSTSLTYLKNVQSIPSEVESQFMTGITEEEKSIIQSVHDLRGITCNLIHDNMTHFCTQTEKKTNDQQVQ